MKKIYLVIGSIIAVGISVIAISFIIEINSASFKETITVDEKGIPFIDLGEISGTQIGKQRHYIIVDRYANNYYKDFVQNGNETAKELFFNNVNWLIEHATNKGNYSIFEYQYPYPPYDFPSGWHDGMAQARGIQIMTKAHKITNDDKYLNESKKLLNAFFVDVKDGGVTYKSKKEGWWYDHYAHEEGKKPRVLNGMMFALLDLKNYYEYTKDPDAKFLFDQGVKALKKNISKYDLNGFTYYNALGTASIKYQKIHVKLVGQMYNATNEEIFNTYYNKWESCDDFCQFFNKKLDKWIYKPFKESIDEL